MALPGFGAADVGTFHRRISAASRRKRALQEMRCCRMAMCE
jgi:hypothetical protein